MNFFLWGGGAEKARVSLLVGEKKCSRDGVWGKQKKEKSLALASTLCFKKHIFSQVTFNPPRVLSDWPHFTQGETEDQRWNGTISRPHGFWILDGNHVSGSLSLQTHV